MIARLKWKTGPSWAPGAISREQPFAHVTWLNPAELGWLMKDVKPTFKTVVNVKLRVALV
jgi:hypothetical protein